MKIKIRDLRRIINQELSTSMLREAAGAGRSEHTWDSFMAAFDRYDDFHGATAAEHVVTQLIDDMVWTHEAVDIMRYKDVLASGRFFTDGQLDDQGRFVGPIEFRAPEAGLWTYSPADHAWSPVDS